MNLHHLPLLSLEQLQTLAASLPGIFGIYQVLPGSLKSLIFSSGVSALNGYSEEEYRSEIQQDANATILPADKSQVENAIATLLATGIDQEMTYRVRHKQAGYVWLHAVGRLLGSYEGKPTILVLYSATSDEAKEQNELLDNTATIIYVVAKESHQLLYANANTKALWPKDDITGKNCYEVAGLRDSPCPWCPLPSLKDGRCHKDALFSPEFGRFYSVDCQEMLYHGREAIAVYARDVTQMQKRQQTLESDKESLNAILGNIPGGVAIFANQDGKLRLYYTNEAFYQVHHGSKAFFQAKGDDALALLSEPDAELVRQELSLVSRGVKKVGVVVYHIVGEDGAIHYVNNEFRFAYVQNGVQYYYASFNSLDSQNKLEAERKHVQEMYERAVEDGKLVVWEYDIKARHISMAENEFSTYDYRKFNLPKEIDNVPDSLVQYIDERSVGDFLAMYRAVEQGAKTAHCEVWYRFFKGQEPRCERISYTTSFDANGKPVRAFGIGQNVTREKLEEAKYQSMYEAVSSKLAGAIASFRVDLSQNRYLSGYSPYTSLMKELATETAEEHVQKTLATICDPAIRSKVGQMLDVQAMINRFQAGESEFSVEYPVLTSRQKRLWVHATVYLMQNPKTNSIEALSYARDITEEKTDEEIVNRLIKEETDFIAIIDSVNGTYSLREKDGGPDSLDQPRPNHSYEDAIQQSIGHFLAEPAQSSEELASLFKLTNIKSELAKAPSYRLSFDCKNPKGGEPLKKQIRFSYLNEDHREILAVQSDITEATKKEQKQIGALQDALLEAEKANNAKSEFLSRISHDIRTPISIITSMTGFAEEDIDKKPALQDDLRKIESANVFLLSLINDVLDISKIDSGKIELKPEPYLFADYVSNIQNMFTPLCENKSLHFEVVSNLASSGVEIDETRLNQITLNLLSNAVKYTPEGGHVGFHCFADPEKDGRVHFAIEAQDDGIGMSESFQKRMFDPFSQEMDNPYRNKAATGTGLGLSIVKRLVELMNGTLSVKSELGKGSLIRVDFVAPSASFTGPAIAIEKSAKVSPLHGTILLAEDNIINAQIAKRLLASFGLQCVHAENGEKAVALFAASKPGSYQGILMDIQMPILNGYEASEKIRSLSHPDAKRIPIIAMTADAFTVALEHSKEAGMNDFITKPINPERLRDVLSKYLA